VTLRDMLTNFHSWYIQNKSDHISHHQQIENTAHNKTLHVLPRIDIDAMWPWSTNYQATYCTMSELYWWDISNIKARLEIMSNSGVVLLILNHSRSTVAG